MKNLFENLEYGDLARVIKPIVSIDEFRSKMGDDKDITVVSFTVMSKEPALDLTNFIEKTYDWVLDADVSSGETTNGNYMVFVEMERNSMVPEQINDLITDILNLTEQKIDDWSFTYLNTKGTFPVDVENLTKRVILSPEAYDRKFQDDVNESINLNKLRSAAGIKPRTAEVTDPLLTSLQVAAGIK